jgi:geranylgeranyl diphosphate synthase type II
LTNAELQAYLRERKTLIDEALDRYLPAAEAYPPVLNQALRYSLFAGGKRIRPVLCLAAAEAVAGGSDAAPLLPVACALELIHTYSLIHDDLPAMDDDDVRRGRPTCHKVFGEAMAILAGDALQTEAFRLMARRDLASPFPVERQLAVIGEVAEAAGFMGMVGGQAADVTAEGKKGDKETLRYIHTRKTGAMIRAAVRAGAILAGAESAILDALGSYGAHIGLAFQIADDILNVEGDRALLGKGTGSDATREKLTYPAVLGLGASRREARRLVEAALEDCAVFGREADPLRAIARYIVDREM